MTDSSQLNFSRALQEAVTVPGVVMQAYSAFHEYSIGNQLLALIQCGMRGLQPGPLRTYKGWQQHGRQVQKGQRALILCMPITYKRNTSTDLAPGEIEPDEVYSTSFMYRARWFVLSQTEGEEFELPAIPHWNAELALENLQITRISFTDTDGNCQGYARDRQIAINPVAQLPQKTLLHETAHVVLGHTLEHTITDGERTPKNPAKSKPKPSLSYAARLSGSTALNTVGVTSRAGCATKRFRKQAQRRSSALPSKSLKQDALISRNDRVT